MQPGRQESAKIKTLPRKRGSISSVCFIGNWGGGDETTCSLKVACKVLSSEKLIERQGEAPKEQANFLFKGRVFSKTLRYVRACGFAAPGCRGSAS